MLYKGKASNAWLNRQKERRTAIVCGVIIIILFLIVAWIEDPDDYHLSNPIGVESTVGK